MNTYEIVNPSDAYTMEAPDLEVAAAAVLLVGHGSYAAKELDGGPGVPLFLLGGVAAVDRWLEKAFGTELTFGDWLADVRQRREDELVAALRSFLIGSRADRASYAKGLELIEGDEARKAWCDHWHDERRSSMNDIGAAAWAYADRIEQDRETEAAHA